MANRSRSTRIEDAGVLRQTTFEREGQVYNVFETRPKRNQDVNRFELRKDGTSDCYVVTFQDHSGDTGQCSCKAWIFRRQDCKHIKMCRSEFMTAQVRRQAPAPAARPARALPPAAAQLTLAGLDELEELQKKLGGLRETYRAKKAEKERLEAEMLAIEHEGNIIKDKVAAIRRSRGKDDGSRLMYAGKVA